MNLQLIAKGVMLYQMSSNRSGCLRMHCYIRFIFTRIHIYPDSHVSYDKDYVYYFRLRMSAFFNLFIFLHLSISSSATAGVKQSSGSVEALNTIDAHLTQPKVSLDTLPKEYGRGTVSRTIQARAADGPRAVVVRLISEGKKVFTRSRIRTNYELDGDLQKAFDDFYSFDPVNVMAKSKEGEASVTGWAGDRFLSLRPKGLKGNPMLDVYDVKRKGRGKYGYRFIYKKTTGD